MSKSNSKPAESAFAGLTAMFASGLDAGLTTGEVSIVVDLDDIEVREQVREEFEDEDNTLVDLGRSLRRRQLQEIGIRDNVPGAAKRYVLIWGERRFRAARIEGLMRLRAKSFGDISDEEASDVQLAENIFQKALTLFEVARKVQRDLDTLGSVEAVLEKHNKSAGWLSKIRGLLKLPEQARRVVVEGISADLEVIHNVKSIEKVNPKAAAALVDDLKASRGKSDARAKTLQVKEAVRPAKKSAASPTPAPKPSREATAGATKKHKATAEVLSRAYVAIFENGGNPKAVLKTLPADEHDAAETFLAACYERGKQSKNVARSIIEGFRAGAFSSDAEGAFALVAFVHGADHGTKFSMLDIFGCVKE